MEWAISPFKMEMPLFPVMENVGFFLGKSASEDIDRMYKNIITVEFVLYFCRWSGLVPKLKLSYFMLFGS